MSDIQRDTMAHAILRHLFFVPVADYRDMQVLAMPEERTRGTVFNARKRLLDKSLIEEVPGMEGYYRITRSGVLRLGKLDEYVYENRDLAVPVSVAFCRKNIAEFKTRTMAHAAGARAYPCDKPEFMNLVLSLNPGLDGKAFSPPAGPRVMKSGILATDRCLTYLENFNVKDIADTGVYYSAREVRDGLRRSGLGLEDTVLGTAVTGIAIREDRLYLVYAQMNDVVIWNGAWEKSLAELFNGTLFPGCFNGKPHGVFMCRTYALAPVIALGAAHGRLRAERDHKRKTEREAEGLTDLARERFLAEAEHKHEQKLKALKNRMRHSKYLNTEDKVLGEICCVPAGPTGIPDMYYVLASDRDRHLAAGLRWFDSPPEPAGASGRTGLVFIPKEGGGLFTGVNLKDGTDAVYVALADCRLLAEIRKAAKKVTVVTRPELAGCISHILGPLTVGFYDIATGGEIRGVTEYDEFGFPSDDSRYEKMTEAYAEKKMAGTVPGGRTVRVHACITEELKKKYEALSRRTGMSVSALIALAMGECAEKGSLADSDRKKPDSQ